MGTDYDYRDFICRDDCSGGLGTDTSVITTPTLLIQSGGTIMLSETVRARVLNKVLERLGPARALEAGNPAETPEPNKFGYADDGKPVIGVDFTGGKYRARIRYCDALSGQDIRVTLLRSDSLTEAIWAYRYAHVALWGSASWCSDDDVVELIQSYRPRWGVRVTSILQEV